MTLVKTRLGKYHPHKKGPVTKFALAFAPYRHILKTLENTTVTTSVQSPLEFDAEKMYLQLENRLVSF